MFNSSFIPEGIYDIIISLSALLNFWIFSVRPAVMLLERYSVTIESGATDCIPLDAAVIGIQLESVTTTVCRVFLSYLIPIPDTGRWKVSPFMDFLALLYSSRKTESMTGSPLILSAFSIAVMRFLSEGTYIILGFLYSSPLLFSQSLRVPFSYEKVYFVPTYLIWVLSLKYPVSLWFSHIFRKSDVENKEGFKSAFAIAFSNQENEE